MLNHYLTVAIIDDDVIMRRCLANFCNLHGLKVTHEAGNGAAFLAQLSKKDRVPNVCLLDVDMPVMDGFETAARLKKKYPAISIIAHSSDNSGLRRKEMLEAGADAYIVKGAPPSNT